MNLLKSEHKRKENSAQHEDLLSEDRLCGYLGIVSEKSDQELVFEYARDKSETAFAELVQRHIDFVYSAALRMVVDPHLAEDITQAVFAAVSRQAANLRNVTVFSAWLHRTTRNQAAMLVRSEVRRREREKRAAAMNESSLNPEEVWEQLAPHLDDALARLEPEDRDALLLRFFEKKTAREVGERLGLSQEAAQKRMVRALERLRAVFAQQGLSVSAATLTAVISAQAVQAAPSALGAAVVAACSSTAVLTAFNASMLSFMTSTKIKTAVVAVLTAGLGTTVVLQHQANTRLREELATLKLAPPVEKPQAIVEPNEELEALRREHLELMRLRGEVTTLRQQLREQAAVRPKPAPPKAAAAQPPADFVPSSNWNYVGLDTPPRAFESFLTVLKGGDPAQIAGMVQWEISWREPVTNEDRALMEKSKQDYLEMLQRAPQKITGFNLAPVPFDAAERTRVFFQTMTADGTRVDSSFEMAQVEGQWKPVLRMGWFDSVPGAPFTTTPVFGPKIDLGD